MGLAYIEGAGGGGVRSSDVTASAADILTGKYDLTAQSDDEVVQGTMPNNGTVNHSLPINGSFTIAKGYHSGSGKVTQSITTKAAATYYATTSDQTISSGQYLSGNQVIKKLTQTNLTGANIKPGVTISVNNGNANVWRVAGTMASKAAATYYATTSDQTISAGRYLSGAQTIKKLTQSNLASANILRGKTISINNGNANVWSVSGASDVLKMVSGGITAMDGFVSLGDTSGTVRYMYKDVAPGITPVWLFVTSNDCFLKKNGTAIWSLVNSYSGNPWNRLGYYALTAESIANAPFTATKCRIPYYNADDEKAEYVIFGY